MELPQRNYCRIDFINTCHLWNLRGILVYRAEQRCKNREQGRNFGIGRRSIFVDTGNLRDLWNLLGLSHGQGSGNCA